MKLTINELIEKLTPALEEVGIKLDVENRRIYKGEKSIAIFFYVTATRGAKVELVSPSNYNRKTLYKVESIVKESVRLFEIKENIDKRNKEREEKLTIYRNKGKEFNLHPQRIVSKDQRFGMTVRISLGDFDYVDLSKLSGIQAQVSSLKKLTDVEELINFILEDLKA